LKTSQIRLHHSNRQNLIIQRQSLQESDAMIF
jgi:hypothetical protein